MSKKAEPKLAPREWQARHNAAYAMVQRAYCTMLEFWRACRHKPCRRAKRCSGDQRACLKRGRKDLADETCIRAQRRMFAETPANADSFERSARLYSPGQFML